ncbi:hypothetical protein [Halobaculum marinum]|uniref:Uncharacterized protein n=1 Tax=Halobaculum marinum TaxID=3031996 RepID=A0ABD5WXE7_9EURY|nr:hypothetical protein [Halobaculum sp. DT55]
MHRPAVPDPYIEEVAQRTDFSVDDVRIGLRVLHDAVQSRIAEQYRRARDDDTPNHLLTDDAASAWFAFAFADLRAELEAAGYEMDADLLAAVAAVNMTVFQEVHDRTVSFPRALADRSDTPFFYPVYVEKPDWWREAETRTLRSLVGLLDAGSSPAAALDAWAVNLAGMDADEWAAVRGVEPDRVRSNAADAPDPAPEAADGLRAEAREGVPDGPYDPATDRLFVPTTDQLAAAREAEAQAGDDTEADPDPGVDEATDPDVDVKADPATDPDTDADADPEAGPDTDPDPDRLSDIDPEDLLAGDVDVADLPEFAVQGGDDGDDADEGGERFIDGAAAFEREDERGEADDGGGR